MHCRFRSVATPRAIGCLPIRRHLLCKSPTAKLLHSPNYTISTHSESQTYGEAGFRDLYARMKSPPTAESPQSREVVADSNHSGPANHTMPPPQRTQPMTCVPCAMPPMMPYQPLPAAHAETPADAHPTQPRPGVRQDLPAVHLREICSFLALAQYCADHNLRFLLILICLLSSALIDLCTTTLYFGLLDENKFILPAILFYMLGLCNGRALAVFWLSILLFKLPSHLSFVVQDERGVSSRPSAMRWQFGRYEVSSSIFFSLAVAVSFVRLTIPLQLFFGRILFAV